MAQWLKALILAEEPDSAPSIHMAAPVPRDPKPSVGTRLTWHVVHIHICRQNSLNK